MNDWIWMKFHKKSSKIRLSSNYIICLFFFKFECASCVYLFGLDVLLFFSQALWRRFENHSLLCEKNFCVLRSIEILFSSLKKLNDANLVKYFISKFLNECILEENFQLNWSIPIFGFTVYEFAMALKWAAWKKHFSLLLSSANRKCYDESYESSIKLPFGLSTLPSIEMEMELSLLLIAPFLQSFYVVVAANYCFAIFREAWMHSHKTHAHKNERWRFPISNYRCMEIDATLSSLNVLFYRRDETKYCISSLAWHCCYIFELW